MLKNHFESPYSLALFIRIYRVGKENTVFCFRNNLRNLPDYVYKDIWTPRIHEELTCEREPGNQHDEHAMKVLKDGEIVGHIP